MLQVNFIMINKISALLRMTRILKHFLRSIIDFYILKHLFFSQHIMMESSSLEEENIIKDIRNLFRFEKLKKETTDTTLKI